MTASALSASACSDEPLRYFEWITRAAVSCRHEDHIQILLGVEGERALHEHELAHLAGHGGAAPVRVGNAAWRQQLDVLGHVLDCAWVLRDALGTPDEFTRAFLCQLADRAARQWRETDSSIWEGREGERHHVVSKLYRWVALTVRCGCTARSAATVRAGPPSATRCATSCCATPGTPGAAPTRARSARTTSTRASCSCPASACSTAPTRACAGRSPRFLISCGNDGLLRRWTGAEDGPFLLASFWLSQCHAAAGELDRAHEVFARAAYGQRPRAALRGGRPAGQRPAAHLPRRPRQRCPGADRGRARRGRAAA